MPLHFSLLQFLAFSILILWVCIMTLAFFNPLFRALSAFFTFVAHNLIALAFMLLWLYAMIIVGIIVSIGDCVDFIVDKARIAWKRLQEI